MYIINLHQVVLLIVCFFVGGYFTGLTSAGSSRSSPVIDDSPDTAVPEIDLDDICSKQKPKCPTSYQGIPPLLIISLDGFRPDYLTRGFTPTLRKISQCGARAQYMYPVFPTKTFPNHYSQVTGLNPESHGIIDNNMYDPIHKKMFKLGTAETFKSYWWEGEPIWVTAEKQGKKTGCFFWPGSDVVIHDTRPSYYMKYDSKVPWNFRVDTIMTWLDLPLHERPSFLTLYVNEPDNAAHKSGIYSKNVNNALKKVDTMLTKLFAALQQRQLLGCVNVIIVSDHGMSDISCDRLIALDKYMNMSEVYSTVGAFGRLRPKGKKNSTLEQKIVTDLQCKHSNMRVYLKEDLPVRHHYSVNRRIEAVFVDIDAGWMVSRSSPSPEDSFCSGGAHGYDNLAPDMKALFLAYGPSFKTNYTVKPFINIELYELMTELMNITGKPNNGTRGSLHHLLKNPQLLPHNVEPGPPVILKVPEDDKEYDFRVYAARCPCAGEMKQQDVENITQSHNNHLPFGVPHSAEDNNTLRLLYNDDYVSAYDLKLRLPLWTAYTLSRHVEVTDNEPCWMGDARIPIEDSPKCADYNESIVFNKNIVQRPLFPLYYFTIITVGRFMSAVLQLEMLKRFNDFSSNSMDQANLVTNSVPKSLNHTNMIENEFHRIIAQWTEEEGSLNVVTGPAFDVHGTGVRPELGNIMMIHETYGPLVVPTHFFAVITWCQVQFTSVQECSPSELDVISVILPNVPLVTNCQTSTQLMASHVARVVDVEVLTGIKFFTGLPVYDAVRLRTSVPERQKDTKL